MFLIDTKTHIHTHKLPHSHTQHTNAHIDTHIYTWTQAHIYMGHRDQDGKKVDEMSLFF